MKIPGLLTALILCAGLERPSFSWLKAGDKDRESHPPLCWEEIQ